MHMHTMHTTRVVVVLDSTLPASKLLSRSSSTSSYVCAYCMDTLAMLSIHNNVTMYAYELVCHTFIHHDVCHSIILSIYMHTLASIMYVCVITQLLLEYHTPS